MKKIIFLFLAVALITSLVACGTKPETETKTDEEVDTTLDEGLEEFEQKQLKDEEIYHDLVEDYQKAVKEYDLEDLEADENIVQKYPLVSPTLLMHIARYTNEGVELNFAYCDIDKNGVDELLVRADEAIGAIYSYDNTTKQPVKIFFQDTLERGDLAIYDNGVILSEGAGGAALHYYEFGTIGTDGITYQVAEKIEEEYLEENETPVYRNAETGEVLEYKSLDEIMEKYIPNA